MAGGRANIGGRVAVGAAAAILAVCAAGGPLYVSSAASQAVQIQLDDGCLADDGMHLDLLFDQAHPRLDAAARTVAHTTGPPVVTETTQPYLYHLAGTDGPQRRIVLAHRDGQEANLGPGIVTPGPGQVLVPDWYLPIGGVKVGDRLDLTVPAPVVLDVDNRPLPDQPAPTTMELTVVGTYPEIPVRPEPSYWCGLRAFLRPNNFGDPPLPLALVAPETLSGVPFEQRDRGWELRPDSHGLTSDQAEHMTGEFDRLAAAYGDDAAVTVRELKELKSYTSGLAAVTGYAGRLSEVVSRTVAPVRLTGFAASGALLAAAGVLMARERRRDLRLRVLRGVGPTRLAGLLGVTALPAVLIGTAVGAAVAVLAVVTVGPTPELEPAALRRALAATVAGALGAVLVVGVVGAVAANRTVDTRPRRVTANRLVVPALVAVIAITVASYLRLDQAGGVRLVGSEPQGGDLLAQAFPLLAVAAPLLLLAGPLAFGLRRARFAGRRLRPSLLLGVRRVVLEPAVTVTLVVAIALASGTYVVASALTSSAERTLDDKAATFLGADLVVSTDGLPPLPAGLADRSTIVERAGLRSGSYGVDLLGVDRATFARAVAWRSDTTGHSLAATLDPIAWDGVGGAVPAIVVGRPLDDKQLRSVQGGGMLVQPVAHAAFFPGFRNGATLVVVDRQALADATFGAAEEIWIRQPPAEAATQLTSAGIVVRNPRERADVFEVTSFLTVRWSYGALAAFGLLVAVVVLVAQLLVLDARRGPRQAAFVLTRRMGHRVVDEALAVFTELALPLLGGVALGTVLGVGVCRVAVPRLDTLRQLEPPARVVVDTASLLPLALTTTLALGLLTVMGVVGVVRARPMEVMRATA